MSNVIRFCNYFFNLCSAFDYGFFSYLTTCRPSPLKTGQKKIFPKDAQMTKNKINSENKIGKLFSHG